MTAKRLEELKKKFVEGNGNLNDLGEIITEMFQSNSAHFKDLKASIKKIESNQEILYDDISKIKDLMNPVYSIIQEDECEEEA